MEFQGRIKKILPLKTGVSQRTGNEWKQLPFIFEYFENETDRFPDSVILDTFDTKVIENLKEGMEVRCGFAHKAKTLTKQDGSEVTINELRLYKIESVRGQQSSQQAPQQANASTADNQSQQQNNGATAPQNQGGENNANDDLPF